MSRSEMAATSNLFSSAFGSAMPPAIIVPQAVREREHRRREEREEGEDAACRARDPGHGAPPVGEPV